jgi:hypothetical protein
MQRFRVDEGRIIAGIPNRARRSPLQVRDKKGFVSHATGATSDAFDGRVDGVDHTEADDAASVPRRALPQLMACRAAACGWRVPCFIRWPGKTKAGSVLDGIVSHQDRLPTFLAAAGDAGISQNLLNGYKADNKTYKVHVDGLNRGAKESPRKSFFYSSDGELMALRRESRRGKRLKKDPLRADARRANGSAHGVPQRSESGVVPQCTNWGCDPLTLSRTAARSASLTRSRTASPICSLTPSPSRSRSASVMR